MKYDKDKRFKEQVGLLIDTMYARDHDIKKSAIVQLSLLGEGVVPYLCEFLETKIPVHGGFVDELSKPEDELCWVLGIIGDKRAVPVLKKLLPLTEAVVALAKIGTPEAQSIIIDQLPQWFDEWKDHFDQPIASHITLINKSSKVDTVFKYFDDNGVPALSKAMKEHKDPKVRSYASMILSEMSSDMKISALIPLLNDPDPEVTIPIILRITKSKAVEAYPVLVDIWNKIKDNSDWKVPEKKPERVTAENLYATVADRYKPQSSLPSSYITLKSAVFDALVAIGDDKIAEEFLGAFCKKADSEYEDRHQRGIVTMRPDNYEDAEHFKNALLSMSDRAIPALIKGIQSEDEKTQDLSKLLLNRIQEKIRERKREKADE